MRRYPIIAVAVLALAHASPAQAQRTYSDESDASWLDNCRHNNGWGDDRGRACEVREVPMHLAGRSLDIDARENGSIRARGDDGNAVRVTARLQANARSDEEARRILADVRITADGRGVRAEGPSMEGGDGRSWSTSYVVLVPRRFDLSFAAHNGSLRVSGVQGRIDLRTQNGSVGLDDVGGEVHAHTQNGSLNVQLAGSRWDGSGLDAETVNGSVRLNVPDRYAAQLETGTVNGRINTEIPITVQGNVTRRLSVPLNGGGPTIRAMTTNGSVVITKR